MVHKNWSKLDNDGPEKLELSRKKKYQRGKACMGYFNALYGSPPSEPRNEERWIIDRQESKRRQNRNSRIRKCKRAQERAAQLAAERAAQREAEEVPETNADQVELARDAEDDGKKIAERALILESLTMATASFTQFNREGAKGIGKQSEMEVCETTQSMELQPLVEMQEDEEEAEEDALNRTIENASTSNS